MRFLWVLSVPSIDSLQLCIFLYQLYQDRKADVAWFWIPLRYDHNLRFWTRKSPYFRIRRFTWIFFRCPFSALYWTSTKSMLWLSVCRWHHWEEQFTWMILGTEGFTVHKQRSKCIFFSLQNSTAEMQSNSLFLNKSQDKFFCCIHL